MFPIPNCEPELRKISEAGHVDYICDIKKSPFGKQTSVSKILEVKPVCETSSNREFFSPSSVPEIGWRRAKSCWEVE